MERLLIAVAAGLLVSCSVKRHPLFQCPDMSPSRSVPTSEFVKPADIKVIAALGDSLTSIGGHKTCQDVITLPIFKLFNPNIIGASSGKTFLMTKTNFKSMGFNLAGLPLQTRLLIERLKLYEGVNFEDDWKLLTILIGMNDICGYCRNKALYSVDNYVHFIKVSLEMLMNEVPRMIVNVVQIVRMQSLREAKKRTPGCFLQLQKRLEELLNSDRFFKKDFAVVLQPFLKDADLPRLPNGKCDMTFFSADCFHISMKGHEEMAKGLWNNMFQPVGNKTTVTNFSKPIKLICPP
uniref:Si:dkey-177p2.18 n=1 Tax=Kryptolebias marmoratus TaxID=37003 RepID=A0A3Q3GQS1_KRYMA